MPEQIHFQYFTGKGRQAQGLNSIGSSLHGIDISRVKGTGDNGRIVKKDVEAAIARLAQMARAPDMNINHDASVVVVGVTLVI